MVDARTFKSKNRTKRLRVLFSAKHPLPDVAKASPRAALRKKARTKWPLDPEAHSQALLFG
jgi:hypothetical protein